MIIILYSPDPDNLAFLMNHLQSIASHWRAFGLQLGLSSGELDTIEATPLLIPGAPAAYLQEVLSRWLKCAPPFPTLSKLCGALRNRAVGQSRIALELEKQYQTQRTGLSAYKQLLTLTLTCDLCACVLHVCATEWTYQQLSITIRLVSVYTSAWDCAKGFTMTTM